jgi:NAD(P)-dependent dehydrogenase (short-subunit alcohol dehydrogenase family)
MLLKDKVVIVSGLGPGLGLDLARIAALEGAKVALGARNEDNLKSAAREIEEAGGEVLWRRTDVSNNEDCLALATAAADRWGGIDALVNNAFRSDPLELIETADFDTWRAIFDVNLFGSLQMAQACVPAMKQRGAGYIVNVSSMAHRKPVPTMGAYSAAKASLEGATRYLAKELGPYGIRANTARMGYIEGPTVTGYLGEVSRQTGASVEEVAKFLTNDISLGTIPGGQDCARAVLFLCTEWASAISGAVLDINGGDYMPAG